MRYYESSKNRQYSIQIHIADIHFGSIDPVEQSKILIEQFLIPISSIDFDILSIDGDLFDRKFMANSEAIYYAMDFIHRCVNICIEKQATLILLAGTESHDANQLKLFYNYSNHEYLDMRIVEHIQTEYVQGLKILCIPEEYGKGEEYYTSYLNKPHDMVFMHGTVVGSVYGANKEDLNSSKYPVFSIDSFKGCMGPIVCGHVHKAMCLNGYIYYCSNPIRYKFGEEEDKGFNVLMYDKVTHKHIMNFIPIESFRYDTVDIKTLEYNDPNTVINYLNNLLEQGVHNIRIDFSDIDIPTVQRIVEEYYSNNNHISIKRYVDKSGPNVNTTEEIENKYADLDFLLDPTLDSYAKFVHFINHNMGKQFITVEALKKVLSGGDIK